MEPEVDPEIMKLYEDFVRDFDIAQALHDLIDPNPYGFIQCEYPKKAITFEEDKNDKNLPVVVKRNGKEIGRVAKFNNGFTKDGHPLPLE